MNAKYSLRHLKTDEDIELKTSPSLVGRSSNCDLQIDRETLSREHARIILKVESLVVEDLHSTNGTFVNEQQIFEACELQPGDVVRFGQESFCVQSSASDATQMFDRNAMQNAASSMLVSDEEEEDGTVMLQAISLPVGWEKAAVPAGTKLSEDDEGLVNALKKHARKKLKHPFGLFISIIEDGRAPVVKLLSTENNSAEWILGRAIDASIVLNDNRVSDKHLKIRFSNKLWSIEDLSSRNGTYVRNVKVDNMNIEKTTEISIGHYAIFVEPISKA